MAETLSIKIKTKQPIKHAAEPNYEAGFVPPEVKLDLGEHTIQLLPLEERDDRPESYYVGGRLQIDGDEIDQVDILSDRVIFHTLHGDCREYVTGSPYVNQASDQRMQRSTIHIELGTSISYTLES